MPSPLERIKEFLEDYASRNPSEKERVERYIKILELEGTPQHLEEKLVLLIFRSFVIGNINPWEVDLKTFLDAYRQIIHDQGDVDFFIAAKILFYSVLLLYQKAELLMLQFEERRHEEEFIEPSSEEISFRIVRREKQKITLVDILKFVENIGHILERERKKKKRKRVLRPLFEIPPLEEHVHGDVEELVKRIKDNISKLNGRKLLVSDIAEEFNVDLISAFIAVLFLIMDGILDVYYENGLIILKVISDGGSKKAKEVGS